MSIDQTNTKELIASLVTKPQDFASSGKAHVLLQRYLEGEDVISLRPLLLNSHQLVQEEALWILSELGIKGVPLMQEAMILHESAPIWQMRATALEIIAVCSIGEHLDKYMHVILALESPQSLCRCIAMSLVARSLDAQLKCTLTKLEAAEEKKTLHRHGLNLL